MIDEPEALGPKPVESLSPEGARQQPTFTDAVHLGMTRVLDSSRLAVLQSALALNAAFGG